MLAVLFHTNYESAEQIRSLEDAKNYHFLERKLTFFKVVLSEWRDPIQYSVQLELFLLNSVVFLRF